MRIDRRGFLATAVAALTERSIASATNGIPASPVPSAQYIVPGSQFPGLKLRFLGTGAID